jgi:hypothetical protein
LGPLLMVEKAICGYNTSKYDCYGAHIACRG